MTNPPITPEERAASLLDKMRVFAATLDDDERELFAVLIGPGVAALSSPSHPESDSHDDVVGYTHEPVWTPGSLRSAMAGALDRSSWRIVDEGAGSASERSP